MVTMVTSTSSQNYYSSSLFSFIYTPGKRDSEMLMKCYLPPGDEREDFALECLHNLVRNTLKDNFFETLKTAQC